MVAVHRQVEGRAGHGLHDLRPRGSRGACSPHPHSSADASGHTTTTNGTGGRTGEESPAEQPGARPALGPVEEVGGGGGGDTADVPRPVPALPDSSTRHPSHHGSGMRTSLSLWEVHASSFCFRFTGRVCRAGPERLLTLKSKEVTSVTHKTAPCPC